MERTGKAFLREVELLCWWRSWPGTTSWWLLVSLFPPSAQVRAKMKSNRTHMNPGRRSPQLPCCRTVIFTQFDKWTVMFSSAQLSMMMRTRPKLSPTRHGDARTFTHEPHVKITHEVIPLCSRYPSIKLMRSPDVNSRHTISERPTTGSVCSRKLCHSLV